MTNKYCNGKDRHTYAEANPKQCSICDMLNPGYMNEHHWTILHLAETMTRGPCDGDEDFEEFYELVDADLLDYHDGFHITYKGLELLKQSPRRKST